MQQHNGLYTLKRLQLQWRSLAIACNLLLCVSITALAAVLLHKIFGLGAWVAAPILLLVAAILFVINKGWQIGLHDVVSHINFAVAGVQESTHLLLKPNSNLNLLEQLQAKKLDDLLSSTPITNPLKNKLKIAIVAAIASLVLCVIFSRLSFSFNSNSQPTNIANSTKPEVHLPEIKASTVSINPPAYTGRKTRQQKQFNLQVEEGSTVSWNIETNMPVKTVELVFNDQSKLALKATAQTNKWSASKQFNKPGFYQVKINDHLSEMYQVEVVKDKPPVISISSPKSGTIIENGRPKQVVLQAELADDYGVRNAFINATIASGSGEAVKFKEQQLSLAGFAPGRLQQQFKQLINLALLGMAPGDELYFYLQATDARGQQTRSDIFLVTIQDTAQLMSIDGLVNGLDLKPEFFRSQRQIIIETEQLLKGKDTMSVQDFNNKSNDLGIDQKLLRLRYGKFLGEETNTEIGGDHDEHGAGHSEPAFGDANAIMDEFAHKHDIAEDATFFDPETKKQLKATLAEMWKAEGKLRTLKPAEALPFEYKALRLLKDLQQKSRVYVPKTGFKATPLKPEKRLTGELDKIGQPVYQENFSNSNNVVELRRALAALDAMKNTPSSQASLTLLRKAGDVLAANAANNPSKYLAALEAYKKIATGKAQKQDVVQVEKALQSILQAPANLPFKNESTGNTLSQQYFMNLKKGAR